MLALVGLIATQAGMGHAIRLSERLGRSPAWTAFLQYLVALVVACVWWGLAGRPTLHGREGLCGALVGACGVCGFFLFHHGMRQTGVAIMQAIGRLSVAVPVAASVLVWHETPSRLQVLGFVLVAVAVPLLAYSTALRNPHRSRWKLPLLLAQFLAMGAMGLAYKAVSQAGHGRVGPGFFVVCFGTAGLGSLVWAAASRERPHWQNAAVGAGMAIMNVLQKIFILVALEALPGVVVPVATAGTIVLSMAMAMMFWQERYTRRALLGLALALGAIVAIQLGG